MPRRLDYLRVAKRRTRTREGHAGRLDRGHPGLRGRRQADIHRRWEDDLRRSRRVDVGRVVDRRGRGVLVILAT